MPLQSDRLALIEALARDALDTHKEGPASILALRILAACLDYPKVAALDDLSKPDHVEQPPPIPNDRESIQSLVRTDLVEREKVGISRYGTSLQPFNGRDAFRDAYEEALDLACYMRQIIEERDNPDRMTPEEHDDVIEKLIREGREIAAERERRERNA